MRNFTRIAIAIVAATVAVSTDRPRRSRPPGPVG
jgi:hypothetical protein